MAKLLDGSQATTQSKVTRPKRGQACGCAGIEDNKQLLLPLLQLTIAPAWMRSASPSSIAGTRTAVPAAERSRLSYARAVPYPSAKHARLIPPHMHAPPSNKFTKYAALMSHMQFSQRSDNVFARSSACRWAHRAAQHTPSACACFMNTNSTSLSTTADTSPDAAPPP